MGSHFSRVEWWGEAVEGGLLLLRCVEDGRIAVSLNVESLDTYLSGSHDITSHEFWDKPARARENKLSKASEFLWGVINNLVYSIGLFYDLKLSKHKEIRKFIKKISEEVSDDDLYDFFLEAETLHANFYHNFMDEELFEKNKDDILILIEKLNTILDEAKESKEDIDENN